MAWNSDKAKTQHYTPAYIEKETLAAAENNQYIKSASALLIDKATELMNTFKNANINLTLKRQDGTEYNSKAVVSVKQASSYDKETKKETALFRKDGSPIMSLSISVKTAPDDTVTLYAKEDISNGVVIQNMTMKTWENRKPKLFKLDDIKEGNVRCAPATTAVMNNILSNSVIQEKDAQSSLENLTVEINKLFASISDKVPSTQPDENGNHRLVNNAYAQYVNDEFGEQCVLRNHSDNIVVELGVTSEGKKYARATNFDCPVETPEGIRYESMFINKTEDLENLNDEAIIQVIASYKEIDLPKFKQQSEERAGSAKDVRASFDDVYPF